jgi:hypothetical protein
MVETIPTNIKVLTEINVYRDGKLIQTVKPYETASLWDKIKYHCGLLNMTRSV